MNKLIIKLIIWTLIALAAIVFSPYRDKFTSHRTLYSNNEELTDLSAFKNAYENQQSNIQVKQNGRIVKILQDDEQSPRHQRFIVQLDSGQKLLIAHNIDLATKIEDLKEGTAISFKGEYEWNNKGGVVHWTHHDPKGMHPDGWLLYQNHIYN